MPDPDSLQVPLQCTANLAVHNYVMSANKCSHTFSLSLFFFFFLFFFPQLKTNQQMPGEMFSGLHPKPCKQMCKEPQLETPSRQQLEVGSLPNKPDDSVKGKRTN